MYLIVGATGSLGGGVAKALLQQGEEVRAVVRPESPLRMTGRFTDPEELRSLGAEIVQGDVTRPATLEPHLQGVRAVLSTASGTKRAPPDTIEAVDHQGTAAVAALAKEAGVQHFVYVSARGAGPEAPPFMRIKWGAEQAVRERGPAATIVRPAPFMQDWIGFVLGAQLQGGTRVQVVGDRDPWRTYVHEGDVVRLLTAVLLGAPPSGNGGVNQVDFSADSAAAAYIVGRMANASGMPLELERIPLGQAVDTAPEPLATSITQLLSMVVGMEDDTYVSTEITPRFGFVPRVIDDYVQEMFSAVAG